MTFMMFSEHWTALSDAAERRGLHFGTFLADLIAAVVEDDLVDAIMEDGADAADRQGARRP